MGGGRFCGSHEQKQAHGAVDGPIPENKLIEFRKIARVRAQGSVGALLGSAGTAVVPPSADVNPVAPQRSGGHGMAPVRGSRIMVPRRTEIATMEDVLAENEYVEREMRRRDFHLQHGQWVDGVLLPGDPVDHVDLEAVLREQFRAQQAETRAAAWGPGYALGHR